MNIGDRIAIVNHPSVPMGDQGRRGTVIAIVPHVSRRPLLLLKVQLDGKLGSSTYSEEWVTHLGVVDLIADLGR